MSFNYSSYTSEPLYDTGTDSYGGMLRAPSPNGGTGFYRVEKRTSDNRWMYVSPLGNYMYLNACQVTDPDLHSAGYINKLTSKYGDKNAPNYRVQLAKRMRYWRLNSLGHAWAIRFDPIGMFGNTPMPDPLKFPIVRPVAVTNAIVVQSRVKSIFGRFNTAVYDPGVVFLLDAYDPSLPGHIAEFNDNGLSEFNTPITNSPWILYAGADDADFWHGMKASDHEHVGWSCMITAPTQDVNIYSFPPNDPYTDTTCYTKLAIRDFLQARYGTLSALNTAWGSDYTSFGNDGGWPRGSTAGTGVLDEDGSTSWLTPSGAPPDRAHLTGIPANVKTDLDDFMGEFSEKLCGIWVTELRKKQPNHIIMTPNALGPNLYTKPKILNAFKNHFDMMIFSTNLAEIADVKQFYDGIQMPGLLWVGITAQADSPKSGPPPSTDNPTQEDRGLYYESMIYDKLLTGTEGQATDGTIYLCGLQWWEISDSTTENINWGLTTELDNVYDGVSCVTSTGVDRWGFPAGGEAGNYGDFITKYKEVNKKITELI